MASINRHHDLRSLLERLNLGGMAEAFADLALKAAKENLTHEAYLYELAKREDEQRTQGVPHASCAPLGFLKKKRFAASISRACRRTSSCRSNGSKLARF